MYLQLAEDGNPMDGSNYIPPSVYMADPGHLITVRGYKKKGSRVPIHLRRLSEDVPAYGENPYVFIPDLSGQTAGFQVREDWFDWMTPEEWRSFMLELLPYQPPVASGAMSEGEYLLSGLFGLIPPRATRIANRTAKVEAKTAKQNAKADLKNAKADRKAAGGGSGGGILDTISGAIGNIAGTALGIPRAPKGAAPDAGGDDNSGGGKILGMSYPVAGLVGAGVVGIGIFLATRKRKR